MRFVVIFNKVLYMYVRIVCMYVCMYDAYSLTGIMWDYLLVISVTAYAVFERYTDVVIITIMFVY